MRERMARQENDEEFKEEYSRPLSDVSAGILKAVLGSELGIAGYTTTAEADLLVDHVQVGPGRRLLDLGAGRGWPGIHLMTSTKCSLFATDIPTEALVAARTNIAAANPGLPAHVVAADGRAIPFESAVFDAVTHADVFC